MKNNFLVGAIVNLNNNAKAAIWLAEWLHTTGVSAKGRR